jgi:hypothetical protein
MITRILKHFHMDTNSLNRACHSSFTTYHRDRNKVTRRVPHVEQELLTLTEHTSAPRFLMSLSC